MIKVYSRPGCVYCPLVSKYLDMLGAEYTVETAEGDEYMQYANKYGFNVPLTVNGDKGFMGWNAAKIKELTL